ncbi:MAG: hypothetical protein ACLQVJ_08535 [Syntrophobacteraceae bacterium]
MAKSLKEQNRWYLWLIIAANSLFLYTVVQTNAIETAGLRTIFKDTSSLLPVGFVVIIATVLNGLLSAENKARLVFLRWHYALPGHRAFSRYAKADPRIDLERLMKMHCSALPVDPIQQNRAWYSLYKSVENHHAVLQVHRDFLLLRDYTGLAALFVVFLGASGLYAIPSLKISSAYLLLLLIQFLVVRHAAATYGIRLVTTELAHKSAER